MLVLRWFSKVGTEYKQFKLSICTFPYFLHLNVRRCTPFYWKKAEIQFH